MRRTFILEDDTPFNFEPYLATGATAQIVVNGDTVGFFGSLDEDAPSDTTEMIAVALDADGNTTTTTDLILTFKGFPKWIAYKGNGNAVVSVLEGKR